MSKVKNKAKGNPTATTTPANTNEMSKTAQERIENVFDTFVVSKLIAEIDPIKKEFKHSGDEKYKDFTTRDCIVNISKSVTDLETNVKRIRTSIMLNDPTFNLGEAVQRIEYNQETLQENLEDLDEKLSSLPDDLMGKFSNEVAEDRQKFEKEIHSLSRHMEDSFAEQRKKTEEQTELSKENAGEIKSCLEALNDKVAENAALIKEETEKISDSAAQSLSESVADIEKSISRNVSELKKYVEDALAAYDSKMSDINTTNMKSTGIMLKILVGISAVNTIGIITAIILKLI